MARSSLFCGALSCALLLAACTPGPLPPAPEDTTTPPPAMERSDEPAMTEAASSAAAMERSPLPASSATDAPVDRNEDTGGNGNPVMKQDTRDPKLVDLTASNFQFSPAVIRVQKGQKLTLRLTSIEGVHGLGIPALGINERVEPGKTVEVQVPTDTAGTLDFRCTVPCGPGHKEMTGQIIIE
ncbi:MAG: cytochrome c oxidase subunit II [Candidatus Peregrinibacteria bacterium Greene0416_19]|nr:MAG: cytochrome c oxidase subunit II [Candidatus Peregrinibacteria bacterium Greene0416_19]